MIQRPVAGFQTQASALVPNTRRAMARSRLHFRTDTSLTLCPPKPFERFETEPLYRNHHVPARRKARNMLFIIPARAKYYQSTGPNSTRFFGATGTHPCPCPPPRFAHQHSLRPPPPRNWRIVPERASPDIHFRPGLGGLIPGLRLCHLHFQGKELPFEITSFIWLSVGLCPYEMPQRNSTQVDPRARNPAPNSSPKTPPPNRLMPIHPRPRGTHAARPNLSESGLLCPPNGKDGSKT